MQVRPVVVACAVILAACAPRPSAPSAPFARAPATTDAAGSFDEGGWRAAIDRAVRQLERAPFGDAALAISLDDAGDAIGGGSSTLIALAIDGGAPERVDDGLFTRATTPGLHVIAVTVRLTGPPCGYCSGFGFLLKRAFEVRVGSGSLSLVRLAVREQGGPTMPLEERLRLDFAVRAWRRTTSSDATVVTTMESLDAAIDVATSLVERSRRARDVIFLVCANDKLTQLRVMRLVAREHAARLAEASVAGDAPEIAHQHAIFAVLAERATRLSSDAQQCIGE